MLLLVTVLVLLRGKVSSTEEASMSPVLTQVIVKVTNVLLYIFPLFFDSIQKVILELNLEFLKFHCSLSLLIENLNV